MSIIYLVSTLGMEPYETYGDGPALAFYSKAEAKSFIKDHPDVYDSGYFIWDKEHKTKTPCSVDTKHAYYDYGWAYSGNIAEIELKEST
jgi:hypothetical protein